MFNQDRRCEFCGTTVTGRVYRPGHDELRFCSAAHAKVGRVRPLADRFRARLIPGLPGECWPWPGARLPKGYGKIGSPPGRVVSTHRLAFVLAHGLTLEDIGGQDVLHTCDNPPCCNPAHLFLGVQADNTADMTAKGRAWWLRYGRDAKGQNAG